jgi:thioesterase domain-containing protein
MTGIHSFFNLLRTEGGAVWLEQRSIRLSTPRKLQNEETAQFIRDNKEQIIAVLRENSISSEERFRDTPVLQDSRHTKQPEKFELVKPYHPKRNGRLPYLVFIHPGHGGWEVYQSVADMLGADFNCIGIDNYNRHHTEKILSLTELASVYLSALADKKWLKEPVNLLGWSLGGHIALEMAAFLEKMGYRHINIFLLDTFLPGPPVKYKRNLAQEWEAQEIIEMAANAASEEEKLAVTFEAEYWLSSIPVSRFLKYTSVILFRAAGLQKSPHQKAGPSKKRAGKLPQNHVDEAAATVLTIDLDCGHYDILETSSEMIAEYILSFD